MFGAPLKHSEFGEGFDRKRKYSYASYFVNLEGIDFHIGYDHRGTGVEIGISNRFSTEEEGIEGSVRCLKLCKALVDLYKEKVLVK